MLPIGYDMLSKAKEFIVQSQRQLHIPSITQENNIGLDKKSLIPGGMLRKFLKS